ncbi:DNase I-like protein [Xylariaceae sp. FL0594]|nr:DNase I-like protein [Xylariaceae sp. FL0594]
MAPLARAFIGDYMTRPYFQAYASALNRATAASAAASPRDDAGFTLVHWRNVGMTSIMLFCRDPSAVLSLQSSDVGFGPGDMANKGAVGVRVVMEKRGAQGESSHTEMTFVSAHLAAMEWNLDKRNKNWQAIVSGLLFEDPKKRLAAPSLTGTSPTQGPDSETEGLLGQDSREAAMQAISIYKPGSHLFVAGDLNYRISETSPGPDSDFPDLDPESPNDYKRFLAQDQLAAEMAAGRTLHGMSEAEIAFPPTYKLEWQEEQQSRPGDQADCPDTPLWTWARHRWPGWCDRVLYLDIPQWVRRRPGLARAEMNVIAYDSLPPVRTSDHRAVFLRLAVPVLSPEALAPPDTVSSSETMDPRVRLPYPIDPQAWEHRRFVKKWEAAIGWSMLVSESKRSFAFVATLLLVGLSAWWLRSAYGST